MSSVVKSDIFFFITAIAVVVVAALLVVALIRSIRILRDVRMFLDRVVKEGDEIINDIKGARTLIKEKGSSVAHVVGAITRVIGPKPRPNRSNQTRKKKNTVSSPEDNKVEE